MYSDLFIQAGLSKNEAIIYEYLLNNGVTNAGTIIKNTPLTRGIVYIALNELTEKGLITQKTRNKVAYFSPDHPDKLRELIEKKENELKKAKNSLEANLPSLISGFNLVSNQPGVQYYEGLDGIKKVLNDTLLDNPDKLIYTISDAESYGKYLKDWNSRYYAPKRKELEIMEKVITTDNEGSVKFLEEYMKKDKEAQKFTKVLIIDKNFLPPFDTELNIYGHKASFITFTDKGHIGMIIQNEEIVQTLRSIFLLTWNLGKKYFNEKYPQWHIED